MIAVVGGGLIGASVAFELSQAGAAVVVLDADRRGAAWRAGAGMLTPTGERLHSTPLGDLAARSLSLWPDFARRLAQSSGLNVPFRSGIEHVSYGSDHQPFTITHHSTEATTHPPTVVRAALHGLEVRRTEVLGLEPLRGSVRLHTAAGTLTAERVVMAAGVWSGRFGLPVFPVRGQALLLPTASLPARYSRKARGFPLYGLPRLDGLYVGATARPHGWDTQPRAQDARWLRAAAPLLWPEHALPQQGQMLVGLRPCTQDGQPIVGPLWENGRVWAATGHGRHGALLAPVTTRQIAEALL